MLLKSVGEIDSSGQFHQNFMQAFFVQKCFVKLFFHLHVTREKLPKRLLYKKALVKYWWNWHQGLISSTHLWAAFTPVAPQSVRTRSSRQYLFTLFGSTIVKAVRRTLMKLSPAFRVASACKRCLKLIKPIGWQQQVM